MWNRTLKIAGLMLLFLSLGAATISAQSGGPYTILRSYVGSGAESSAGPYALVSTVGQAEAGATLSGEDYTVVGGFQATAATPSTEENKIYLPLLLRGGS